MTAYGLLMPALLSCVRMGATRDWSDIFRNVPIRSGAASVMLVPVVVRPVGVALAVGLADWVPPACWGVLLSLLVRTNAATPPATRSSRTTTKTPINGPRDLRLGGCTPPY